MPKILYVEDDPDIAELVSGWLAEMGHEVLHTDDGIEALDLAWAEAPDLILLDIELGEFSIKGWEVNRRLKDDPATQGLPVVALSAHAYSDEHRGRALGEKFVEHISKPLNYDALNDRIAACLAAGGGA